MSNNKKPRSQKIKCYHLELCRLHTWKRNTERMPTAAEMQNDCRAGKEASAPIPKAKMSVREVIVIETPACLIVMPKFSTSPLAFLSRSGMLLKHLRGFHI